MITLSSCRSQDAWWRRYTGTSRLKKRPFPHLEAPWKRCERQFFFYFTCTYKSHKWKIYKVSMGAYASPLLNRWRWRMDGSSNYANNPGLETLFTECFHLKPETTFFLSTLTYESVTHSLSNSREGRWEATKPSGKRLQFFSVKYKHMQSILLSKAPVHRRRFDTVTGKKAPGRKLPREARDFF